MQFKKIFLGLAVIFLVEVCINAGLVSGTQDAKSKGATKQAKETKERLEKLGEESDKLVKAIEGLKLTPHKQKRALEFVKKFAADKAAILKKRGPQNWSHFIEDIELFNRLQEDLETVLPEAQMARWINAVVRTEEDNRRFVTDPRVQHRTYKFAEAGGDHGSFISKNPKNLSKVFSFFNIVSKRNAKHSTYNINGFK